MEKITNNKNKMVVAFNNRWCTSAIIEFLRIPNRVCQRTTRSLHVQVMHTVGWYIKGAGPNNH